MPPKEARIKFRFWSGVEQLPAPPSKSDDTQAAPVAPNRGPGARRSRSGCTECRRRRVKCDETFPVCIRCQKRGSFCQSAPRLTKWQHQGPWAKLGYDSLLLSKNADWRAPHSDDKALLRYWMEKASQIMVIDPEENPLSFPILEYTEGCPSLKHALQSVGAGHKNYFDPEKLAECLEERSFALRFIMSGLSCPGDNIFPLFLSVFLVGLSTAWTNPPTADFGQHHLRGARALVDVLLSDSKDSGTRPPYFNFVIGAYLYWDMATSFLIPADQQSPLNTVDMYEAILNIGQEYHPIAGYTTDLFYLLGSVGRYCRSVVEEGVRDTAFETVLEEELENWEPNRDNTQLGIMSDAFRMHGLINLAAICYRRPHEVEMEEKETEEVERDLNDPSTIMSTEMQDMVTWWPSPEEPNILSLTDDFGYSDLLDFGASPDCGDEFPESSGEGNADDSLEPGVDPESTIRKRALHVVRDLTSISADSPCINLQGIPLFTAGSELTKDDEKERILVLQRFKELYSLNHLRANLSVLQILPEIWARKDRGEMISWLDVMLEKNWNMMLG